MSPPPSRVFIYTERNDPTLKTTGTVQSRTILALNHRRYFYNDQTRATIIQSTRRPLRRGYDHTIDDSLTTLLSNQRSGLIMNNTKVRTKLSTGPYDLTSTHINISGNNLIIPMSTSHTGTLHNHSSTRNSKISTPILHTPINHGTMRITTHPTTTRFRIYIILRTPMTQHGLSNLTRLNTSNLRLLSRLQIGRLHHTSTQTNRLMPLRVHNGFHIIIQLGNGCTRSHHLLYQSI